MVDLLGRRLPDVDLPSTLGATINLARLGGLWVCFIYPYTGRPGVPDPPGWDNIAGAHGSTPQAQAYAQLHPALQKLGLNICGCSTLSMDWQAEFAHRFSLPYPLLSDVDGAFSAALQLQTFLAGDRHFLKRRTLICRDGVVVHDRQQVSPPEGDAAEVLAWLESHP